MNVNFVLANYVYLLAKFPEHPPILLASASEKQIFQQARFRYKALSLWLRYLLLGESLAEEAVNTNMKYFQPIAELLAAEFRLAVGVHPRSANPAIREFDSPADLWFACQWIMSEQCLEDDGLTGTPKLEGKTEGLIENRKAIKRLDNLRTSYQQGTDLNFLTGILIVEAHELAKSDHNFELDYFKPYLRVLKRTGKKIERCKQLQKVYLLPDGQLHWTEQGAKLPKLVKEKCKEV